MKKTKKPKPLIKTSFKDNCLTCSLYMKCNDPHKDRSYICGLYKKAPVLELGALSLSTPVDGVDTGIDEYDIETQERVGKDDELELESMLKEILHNRNKVPADLRVDDRDIKEFPNFWTFCTSKNGLNTMPFARQLWMATHMLAEWCPRCSSEDFKTIKGIPVDYPVHNIRDKVTFLEYGRCPKCRARRSSLVKKGELNRYEELDVALGQRSGKSVSTSMISSYIVHKYLKLQNPNLVFGLLQDSMLSATFVALTFYKAVGLLWNPMLSMMRNSPWFREYHSCLDHYSAKYGEQLYKLGDHLIQYRHRNMVLSPSGPSKRTLRGDSRFLAAVDELGWFPNDEKSDDRERQSADEVYIALDRSLQTVRSAAEDVLLKERLDNVPTAYMVCCSSPSDVRDKIMRLVKTNMGSRDALALHLPTWEFNPKLPRSKFRKAYRENPVKAERDFGAQPPLNDSPFFEGDLKKLFKGRPNAVKYHYITKSSLKTGQVMRHAEIEHVQLQGIVPISIMAIDAGLSNNSFSIVVGNEEMVSGKRKFRVTAAVEIAPTHHKNTLNYSRIYTHVMLPLVDKMNVKALVSDRWNSAKVLHDLEEARPDVLCEAYALKYEDLLNVRDYMLGEDQTIILPKMEVSTKDVENMDVTTKYPHCFKYMPMAHMYFQMKTVKDTGNQVVKGNNLTDDVLRATFLASAFFLDEEWWSRNMKGSSKTGRASVGLVIGNSQPMDPRILQKMNNSEHTEKAIGVVSPRRGPY